MNKGQIIRYFRILGRLYRKPCLIVLTGAAAGTLYGGVRASLDIDFAVRLKKRASLSKDRIWTSFTEAAREASFLTGIAVQYAEDIDRWSSITFLDYWDHTRKFRRFGSIEVRLLEPAYWAIGKLTRYLDPDIRDLIQVLKRSKTSWRKLSATLGKALRKSPKSTACFLFRRQVEDFFKTCGRQIWGSSFPSGEAIQVFHSRAGIK